MTHHAQARTQQRGIPHFAIESLLDFGREAHDHRGAQVLFFDHHARKQLKREIGPDSFKRIEAHLGAYAVIGSDGAIVTVGHRTRRINRD